MSPDQSAGRLSKEAAAKSITSRVMAGAMPLLFLPCSRKRRREEGRIEFATKA
jgi:hypothetical protein